MVGMFWEEWEIGAEFHTASRTITEADVVNFAGISGDYNPLHIDEEFCKQTRGNRRDILATLDILQKAKKPVIISGGGVKYSKASAALIRFAEGLNIPVATSLNGKDTLDYLEERKDIINEKIGIAGISLGGYYAPRAAGFEPRIKCVIAG